MKQPLLKIAKQASEDVLPVLNYTYVKGLFWEHLLIYLLDKF